MPTPSRLLVFASLFWLIVFAALPVVNGLAELSGLIYLQVMSVHMFTLGFITQLIIGVAYWMFPRSKNAWPRPLSDKLALLIFIFLNTGLLLRHALYLFAPDAQSAVYATAGTAQFLALILFTMLIWNRMKPIRKPARRS